MKESGRSEAINGGFQLPEAIIQHIQSFLNGKEAARTTLLSKSWHNAFSTRPNLDFDQRHFGSDRLSENEFWEFTNKAMQRYEELNLNIHSFKLFMYKGCNYQICSELIVRAMKMGTVDFSFQTILSFIRLPREVFESETLTTLSISGGGTIDLGEDRVVNCLRLKSLSLHYVWMTSDTLWNIVSSCPLIENLTLIGIWELESVLDGPINVYSLWKLKSLFLGDVDVDTLFFSDLSSNFPFLKELYLRYCGGYNCKGIKISSRSLEYIGFILRHHMLRAEFDLPNIRKFEFSGETFPSLSFKTASRKWESDLTIRYGAKWTFLKLNKLLTCLSSSSITLFLDIGHSLTKEDDLQGLSKIKVENLKIRSNPSLRADDCTLVDCLLQSCRPHFITLYWFSAPRANGILQILRKRLIQEAGGSGSEQM